MQNTEKSPPALTAPNLQRKLDTSTSLSINPELSRRVDFFIELILLLLLIISPVLFGSVDFFPVLIIEIGALLILFLYTVKSACRGFFEFTPYIIYAPLLSFLIYVLIQCLFINLIVPDFSLGAAYGYKIKQEALKLSAYSVLFIIILNDFQKRERINEIIYVLISLGFCLSVFGIIQKLSGAERIFWIGDKQRSISCFSSFPNRNHFASYINMIIFLALGGVFSQFPLLRDYMGNLNKKSILKGLLVTFQKGIWLYLFGLIIMSSSLFFSLSRGGMVSFFCGLIFFSFLIARKGLTRRGYVFLLAILLSTLAVLAWVNAPEQIVERFSTIIRDKNLKVVNQTLETRPIYVDKALDMIGKYKVFGVGFGAFEFIYNEKYAPALFTGYGNTRLYIDHLHNDFVELFCEVGFIGFAIFMIAAALYIFFMMRMLYKRHDPYVVGMGIGAMAGLLSMCVHSLLDFNFHITSNAVLFFVIAGLGIVIAGSRIKEGQEMSLLPSVRVPIAGNLYVRVLLFVVLSAGFFYIAEIITRPYRAYAISGKEKADITDLKEAIRLDPLNDKYHFLLAKYLIQKARRNVEYAPKYIELALKETREAIKLNPWNKYYPEYLEWISEVFTPSIKKLI